MSYTAAVLTISDKGAAGLRTDTSGPAVCSMLEQHGWDVVYTAVIPDDFEQIRAELISCADEKKVSLVLTTGGTGFSPRDITPEATRSVIERETPGIPEAMRWESLKITPRGCLSRSAAGIRGRTLIVNLPGSEKAARENLTAVLDPIRHGVEMLLGSGSADCAHRHHHEHHHHQIPSMNQWLEEAKKAPDADKVGMYLTHTGVVRRTAKAEVRVGQQGLPPVVGLRLICDRNELEQALADIRSMPGIFHVRAWVNEGTLNVGDPMMYVLIGGDIRPHVTAALDKLVSRIKEQCVQEEELFA